MQAEVVQGVQESERILDEVRWGGGGRNVRGDVK